MIKKLRGLDVLVYIYDILMIQQQSQTTEDRLIQVEQVLERLESTVFKANLRESFFMHKSGEYFGYQLINTGISPQPKKIETMEGVLPAKTASS